MGDLISKPALTDVAPQNVEVMPPGTGGPVASAKTTVIMLAVPNDAKTWAAGLIALVVVVLGLSMMFGGSADEVIAAKDQTITILQESNERFAKVAEAAVSNPSVGHHYGILDLGLMIIGGAFLLLMAIFYLLLKAGDCRP